MSLTFKNHNYLVFSQVGKHIILNPNMSCISHICIIWFNDFPPSFSFCICYGHCRIRVGRKWVAWSWLAREAGLDGTVGWRLWRVDMKRSGGACPWFVDWCRGKLMKPPLRIIYPQMGTTGWLNHSSWLRGL